LEILFFEDFLFFFLVIYSVILIVCHSEWNEASLLF